MIGGPFKTFANSYQFRRININVETRCLSAFRIVQRYLTEKKEKRNVKIVIVPGEKD